jgi:hypothetical protein
LLKIQANRVLARHSQWRYLYRAVDQQGQTVDFLLSKNRDKVAELRAIDASSNHQFEEEIDAASSENGLFIAKMEFSIQTLSPCMKS